MFNRSNTISDVIEALVTYRQDILRLAAHYKAENIRVFGSVARGTPRPESDIDFLVDFASDYSLADHLGLEASLEDLLGHPVEVVVAANLRDELRQQIINSAYPIANFTPTLQPQGDFVKDESVYLKDILERIGYIEEDIAEGQEAFFQSRRIRDAVIRNFEIIGEAVKRLQPQTLQSYPNVNWSEIARFRDFLIHHYDKVDPQRIWDYVLTDLQPLKQAVEAILATNTDNTP